MMHVDLPANGCFIYFLKRHGEIVYVGQSKNYFSRISDHKKDKQFDSFCLYQVLDPEYLDVYEFSFICLHKPEYNKSLPPTDFSLSDYQINKIEGGWDHFNQNKPDFVDFINGKLLKLWFLDGFDEHKNIYTQINGLPDKGE